VFTADLHLEDGAWSTRPGIYGDAYYSFNQIIDYCINHGLQLILGGDVLEKKSNSARPIAQLCNGLSRMQAANLDVHYIQGNHEYDRNAPWLSVHKWSRHIHKQTVPINGVRVYGLDWLPPCANRTGRRLSRNQNSDSHKRAGPAHSDAIAGLNLYAGLR